MAAGEHHQVHRICHSAVDHEQFCRYIRHSSFSDRKKEFLVYAASFSDMPGIMLFNFFAAKEAFSGAAVGSFVWHIVLAVVCSVLFSALLFLILAKTKIYVRLFLVFALLIMLYKLGKMLKIPQYMQLQHLDDGILFFIIIGSSIIMMLGVLFYTKKPAGLVEEVI